MSSLLFARACAPGDVDRPRAVSQHHSIPEEAASVFSRKSDIVPSGVRHNLQKHSPAEICPSRMTRSTEAPAECRRRTPHPGPRETGCVQRASADRCRKYEDEREGRRGCRLKMAEELGQGLRKASSGSPWNLRVGSRREARSGRTRAPGCRFWEWTRLTVAVVVFAAFVAAAFTRSLRGRTVGGCLGCVWAGQEASAVCELPKSVSIKKVPSATTSSPTWPPACCRSATAVS
ncbi:uncharacterized protein LOC133349846 [Lethenteron reissneri]|uniref:uncharacterized protein LOC133349846 n=1 Tax=Lethenteron reissneri TaxID=7753 RepID=UPI002AB79CAF|nr:uncharacterized protein LOC133349846 [Lethenteron reissneri]